MYIFGIDTSTNFVSIGITKNENYLGELTLESNKRQLSKLISWIDILLKETRVELLDIDLFCCVQGPGSFTGIRIGLSSIKGITLALNKPVVPLCSLDTFAYDFLHQEFFILIKSNQRFFFWAYYENNARKEEIKLNEIDKILEEIYLLSKNEEILIIIDNSEKFEDEINNFFCKKNKKVVIKNIIPSGIKTAKYGYELFKKGLKTDSLNLNPLYLRKSSAQKDYDEKNK